MAAAKENKVINAVIEWCLSNRVIVILFTAGLIGAGIWAVQNTSIDAIPDLSDVQVIIYTDYPGQSPRVVEDQVTYPLTTKMLSVPYAKDVRGYSSFGYSMIYIIFEEGTDIYRARSRVLEYLSSISSELPPGVSPTLGPDATGLGWVYQYVLQSDRHSLEKLRSIQDWFLRYELSALEGVSEVASVGGAVKQYQINIDPVKLASYGISLKSVTDALKMNNNDADGKLVEFAETEYMIRASGYLKSKSDIEQIAVMPGGNSNVRGGGMSPSPSPGTPVYLRDIAVIEEGPDLRRGIAEWNGEGETVGGIIVMRFGENAPGVIERVKTRLEELKKSLPEGVEIIPAYDRSELIQSAIDNLKDKLFEETLIVALVIIAFLLHIRSSLVAIFTLPTAVLVSFIVMKMQGINANIMSLGGIAIAIGAMVDASIVMVENAHTKLQEEQSKPENATRPRLEVILESSKEVGPSIFYSLLVITVSFMPVFTLEMQEGKLFKPLAFTKTYAMAGAAILAVTIVPVLINYFVRGKLRHEEDHPITKVLMKIYGPVVRFVIEKRWYVIFGAVFISVLTILPFMKLGSEFMPPLYEGDLLYMPTTLPGISASKAGELLQQTDKIIKSFPEVESVFGKIGRAETATDPAPLTMIETTIMLKPMSEWREGMTTDKLVDELNNAVQIPGLTNAWTMPIRTRIDMLSTGIKTPVGIKIAGPDLSQLDKTGAEIEAIIKKIPGTRSVIAERNLGGNYLNYSIRRDKLARYGLTVEDVQDVMMSALGGMNITETIEGLERYPVNVRYQRDYRSEIEQLERVIIPLPSGGNIPVSEVADIFFEKGPDMIKSENAKPNIWVYVDIEGTDLGTYLKMAQNKIREELKLPAGYSIVWSGQYEYIQRANEKLILILPLTILIIMFLLYMNTKSMTRSAVILAALPFSVVGAIWYLYFAGFNMSVAVWVGIIALLGVDAETGVIMFLYLDIAYERYKKEGRLISLDALKEVIYEGAVKRIRPKIMTVMTTFLGLFPILIGMGTGSDVMKRIAAPMAGGIFSSLLLELLVWPAVYYLMKQKEVKAIAENQNNNKITKEAYNA